MIENIENSKHKRKICVLVQNRSEYSRIRSVIRALMRRHDCEVYTILLRSKYSNNRILLEKDNIPIAREIFIGINERIPHSVSRSIGELAVKFSDALAEIRPDILVVLGDRYEALGAVAAAMFMNIFIAHIQGGEVTGTFDEHTRHAITKLSHAHFPATETAREKVIKMGENPNMVWNVGCPGTDTLFEAPLLSFEETRYELYKLTGRAEVFEKLTSDYLLLLQFPVPTEFESARHQIDVTLAALSQTGGSKIVLTPIPDAGGDIVDEAVRAYAAHDPKALLVKHLPPELFINVMRNASVMIGNSSAGIRETGYFGLPTVNIGSRQDGREQSSNIINVIHDTGLIKKAIEFQRKHGPYPIEHVYGDKGSGDKIAEIIAHIDYTKIQKRLAY